MSSPIVPGVGAILSADIAVPEHERELGFYSRVLTTGESPLWRDDLMNNRKETQGPGGTYASAVVEGPVGACLALVPG